MSKILSWFTKNRGQNFTATCIGVACFSTLGMGFVINGPYQEKLREIIQIYKRGKPKPLSDKVQATIKEVLRDCKLKEDEKEKLKFFNVVGEDLFHLGGSNSPWGANIGLPFYFEASEDINFDNLRIQGHESIDWIIDGQDLLTAFALSNKAKKFAIMREIYSCNVWDKLENVMVIPACILFSAVCAKKINQLGDTFKKPLKTRLIVYAMCYSLGFFLYRLLKDPLKHLTEKKSDELAALTGPEYLEGGIEFYEHMLMKNKALRVLLGKNGERRYDSAGNENYFIITPKLPLTKRLELLQKLKEETQQF